MKQYLRTGVFTAAGLLIFLSVITSSAIAGPKIAVDEQTHDFGLAWEDAHLEHTFTVTNQGDEELVINHVKTT